MILHVCNESTKTKVTPVDKTMIQPNAVDLRCSKVYRISGGTFRLAGDKKAHLERREITSMPHSDGDRYFTLTPGYYLVEFDQEVTMGDDEAGMVVSRSSIMRNGIWMTSCLYDSGYHGNMVAGLSVPIGIRFQFPVGERLAQFIVTKAEAVHQYAGSYQGGSI